MQIGRYEQVVATYTRLLVNRSVRISAAQRDSIVQVRDRAGSPDGEAREAAGESVRRVRMPGCRREHGPVPGS